MVHLINGGMKNIMQFSSAITRSTSAPSGYDQIDDTSEGRLKVHAEEAFRAGIKFKARFIGSLEIPKVSFNGVIFRVSINRFTTKIYMTHSTI
jgi:hypothetical protein